MEVYVSLVGGGSARLTLEVSDLYDVAELLRRERGLVGLAMDEEAGRGVSVLVPAHRVAMVTEA